MSDTPTHGVLQLDESDRRRFHHGATGYGVELYGGTADDRITALNEQFNEPLITVDCRKANTSNEVITMALRELGVDDEQINNRSLGPIALRRELNQTRQHFAILELDALNFEEQRSVAQTMKGLAESLHYDDAMLGFTTSVGGAVTNAEPDLSMRIQSWQVGPENR